MTEADGQTAVEQDDGDAHAPPAKQADVATRPRRRRRHSALRVVAAVLELALVVAFIVGGLYVAIERGAFDAVLKREALSILAKTAGAEDYAAEVASTTIRFNNHGHLVLDAKDVVLKPLAGPGEAFRTGHVQIALETLPLLSGRVSVASIAVDGTGINFDALPASEGLASFRIDSLPRRADAIFAALSSFDKAFGKTDVHRLKLKGIDFDVPAQQMRHAQVSIEEIEFERLADGNLSITGTFRVDGARGSITGTTRRQATDLTGLSIDIKDFNIRPFLLQQSRTGQPFIGLDGDLDLHFDAARSQAAAPGSLRLSASLKKGAFYGEGEGSPVTKALVSAHYDFKADKIEVEPSVFEFAETRVPFSGGFIDMDRLDRPEKKGIGIDLLIENGHAAPANLGDRPVDFTAKGFGTFDPDTLELVAPDLLIASQTGVVGGSLSVKFRSPPAPGLAGDSPEISLGLFTDHVAANTIRALWPFWLAGNGRNWVYQNVFGGTIKNGSLALFLPAGRLPLYPEDRITLDARELKIRFDIENTRASIAGDLPPLRDTLAHFEMNGDAIAIGMKKAVAYFPSGRSIDMSDGTFNIANVSAQPVIASVNSTLSGDASALLELTTYRPISTLQDTGFKPAELSGAATVAFKARFALEDIPGAPVPEWSASLKLNDIAIAKPLGGRTVNGITGEMKINPLSAALEADAKVDGVPLHISLVEPLSKASRQKQQRTVTADVDASVLAKLVPGVDSIVTGRVKLKTELRQDGSQKIDGDLGQARVDIPWAGWEKGAGIAARVSFVSTPSGEKFNISDFVFAGDGFGAKGDLLMDKEGLASANFANVKLAPTDDVAVKIVRSKGRYSITANGKSADARGFINRMKSPASDTTNNLDFSVSADIATVTGFNGETMRNVSAVYSVKDGKPVAVKLNAVTGNDQAIVAKLGEAVAGRRSIDLTATDAGAFARFTGLYSNMRGGLLNFNLRYVSDGSWRGVVDIRDFQIVNEQRLQAIVSTKSGKDGKSLNEAVKRNIDVSSQKFSRGYGRLVVDGDTVRVENGVVRGTDVGATFQGILRDGNGQMNMTGTFMPAYGLNRLFAELPIIGMFLGNGRDRGLIGITFRLFGPIDQPALQINPLSIIAPGVFRSIFQFQ